jgi:isoleucyl-tRNA synthetase
MAAPIIHQHDMQGVLIMVRKLVEEDLKINRIQLWKLQKKALTGRGFDCTIHIKVLETVLDCSDWFDTTQRHASALHWQQPNTTFILAKDSDWLLMRWL